MVRWAGGYGTGRWVGWMGSWLVGFDGGWMHQVGSCTGIYVLGHGVEGMVVLHMGR